MHNQLLLEVVEGVGQVNEDMHFGVDGKRVAMESGVLG